MASSIMYIIDEAEEATHEEYTELISRVRRVLKAEKMGLSNSYRVIGGLAVLPPKGKALVIGDIHGDLESLRIILGDYSDGERLIFLGDYGDRGEYSPEVWYTVLRLKLVNPDLVLLLRGNHEGPPDLTPFPHDLPLYFRNRLGSDKGSQLYEMVKGLFPLLCHAVLVEDKYLMVHGGLPSRAHALEEIAEADALHPSAPHLEEILWSDPRDHISGTAPSPRGAGKLFGEDVTTRILGIVKAKTVIRGHEPCPLGFETLHHGKIFTVFSRMGPPYYNEEAAYLPLNLEDPPLDGYDLSEEAVAFTRQQGE
ncbi:MAG: metallophosphoesterase family protein [Candidatus Bathyarchaeia archaeon]